MSRVFVGCEGGLGCPSWFVILFLCLLVLHLFWGWGGLVTGLWPLLQLLVLDSSDARLHRPDALAYGRTLSFCRRGSLPWAFIRPGVSRPRPCLASSLLLVVLTFPCPGFSLGASGRWMVPAPALSWASLGFFPLTSSVGCWLGVVEVYPWLSSLRNFAAVVVTLVFCRVLVGLPSWSCCAFGLLGPVVFLVCILGHLSLVQSGFFLSPHSCHCFPSFGWVCFWSSCGSTA